MLKLGIAIELIVAAVGRWENPLSAFTITCLGFFGFGLILIGVLKNDQRSH